MGVALQVLLHQLRCSMSSEPECWIICARCKDVVSSLFVRSIVFQAHGKNVTASACKDIETCTARVVERGAVAIITTKRKRTNGR